MLEKTVRICGRMRPGGIVADAGDSRGISVDVADDLVLVTVPIVPLETLLQPARFDLFLIPLNKNWGSGGQWRDALNSPVLTVISQQGSNLSADVAYNIPFHPDWLKSSVKSSIDGTVSILSRPEGLSGTVEDGNVLKPNWQDTVRVQLRLPAAANTDYIWVQHEYEFGGVLNSDITPLPKATTTTTTTSTTTTTTTTTTETTTSTTVTTTFPPNPGGNWVFDSYTGDVDLGRISVTAIQVGEGWSFVPPDPGEWVYFASDRRYRYEYAYANAVDDVGSSPPTATVSLMRRARVERLA